MRLCDLPKDCDCINHDGPHWLHMDKLWQESNRKLMARGGTLQLHAFKEAEMRRLKEKLANMKQALMEYGVEDFES